MINTITAAIKSTQTLITTASQQASACPTIILGLSGGPDSVFLFHVLATLQKAGTINLVAAHLDHQWRATSGADAQFCTDLCTSAGIPLVSTTVSALDLPVKFNGSHEDIGRRQRRHFFELVAQSHNADFIALAHHRQDQQETFFMRLLRGTTLSGLTCMKAIDGRYLRPLLQTDKQEILAYLAANNLPFCTDPTNKSDAYLRNRIRKSVIPALRAADGRFDQNFDSAIGHLQQEDAYLRVLAQEAFETIFKNNVGNLPAFKTLHPVLQRRVLMTWLIAEHVPFTPSAALLEELCRFINQPAGGRHQIGGWVVVKKGTDLWVEHNPIS